MACLIIRHLSGPRRAKPDVFVLDEQLVVTFGSDSACDVSFDGGGDMEVRPTHARIERDSRIGDKFWLHDLSGGKGLLVNDAFVGGKVSIRAGDLVRLGPDGPVFEVQVGEAPQEAPAASPTTPESGTTRKPRSIVPWAVGAALAVATAVAAVYGYRGTLQPDGPHPAQTTAPLPLANEPVVAPPAAAAQTAPPPPAAIEPEAPAVSPPTPQVSQAEAPGKASATAPAPPQRVVDQRQGCCSATLGRRSPRGGRSDDRKAA